MANKVAFINAIKGQAIRDMHQYGILASVTIAQAILESGWGESSLTQLANNLFGIKVSSNWQGAYVSMPTKEYHKDGTPYMITANFKKYPSWNESISDHTLLLRNPLYFQVRNAKNYKDCCYALTICGYATDPDYWQQLIKIIEQNKLYEYDKIINIVEVIENMDIKELQAFLNKMGFTDQEGKMLVVDGIAGARTNAAKEKAKRVLGYILK